MRSRVVHGSDVVVGIADGVNKFMKDSFLLVDLFLADIALGNEIIVLCLILEVSKIYLVHDSSIVIFE